MSAITARRRTSRRTGLRTHAGSFVKPTSTTGNQAITGVGFKPKAVIFFSAQASNDRPFLYTTTTINMIGMTTGPSQDACIAWTNDGGIAAGSPCYDHASYSIYCLTHNNGQGSRNWRATLVSFDEDGFTINHGFNGSGAGLIHFLAIGGDGVEAKVVSWLGPTATGNKAITGAGFTPKAALTLCVSSLTSSTAGFLNVGNTSGIGIGVTTATQSASTAMFAHGATLTANKHDATKAVVCPVNPSADHFDAADIVSMDSDGMTVNFTTALAPGPSSILYHTLFLGGALDAGVSDLVMPPTGPTGDRLGPVGVAESATDKTPLALLAFSSVGTTTEWGTAVPGFRLAIGAATSPWYQDQVSSATALGDGGAVSYVAGANSLGSLLDPLVFFNPTPPDLRNPFTVRLVEDLRSEDGGAGQGWYLSWPGGITDTHIIIGLILTG